MPHKSASAILRKRYVRTPRQKARLERVREEMLLGDKIREARESAGLTQMQLAAKIGTQPSVVSRIESADYDGHSMETLRRIAEATHRQLVIDFAPARRAKLG